MQTKKDITQHARSIMIASYGNDVKPESAPDISKVSTINILKKD